MENWTESNGGLEREFRFKDFIQAFAFITQVALIAERKGHHPEWTNVYNVVRIRLSTHDAGGVVTPKDRDLARSIDRISEQGR